MEEKKILLTMIFEPFGIQLIFPQMLKKAKKDILAGKLSITTDGKKIFCDVFDKDMAEENRRLYEKWESKGKIKKIIGYRALKSMGVREVIDHEKNRRITL